MVLIIESVQSDRRFGAAAADSVVRSSMSGVPLPPPARIVGGDVPGGVHPLHGLLPAAGVGDA